MAEDDPPTDDEEDLVSLVMGANRLHQDGTTAWVRPGHAGVCRRLDPPGLLDAWTVTAVGRWFFQYEHFGAIVFAAGGERWVILPEKPQRRYLDQTPPFPTTTLTRLRAVSPETVSDLRPRDEIDLAPRLLGELRRIVLVGDGARLAELLAILDLLAVFGGYGSGEIEPGKVTLVESPPVPYGLHASGMVHRFWPLDGCVGGGVTEVAMVRLSIGERGWAFTRDLVSYESEDGIPMS